MRKSKPANQKLLWAPWRKSYILKVSKGSGCVFCVALKNKNDTKNFILRRTRHAFAILNIYPYNGGHLMVVPKRHVNNLGKLNDVELLDVIKLQNIMVELVRKRLKPHGLNLGINMGRSAGAGVLGHIHIHIVPRWNGDANFMPMIARTKVISESLKSLFARLTLPQS